MHRPAIGTDLLVELLRQQRVFQRGELRVTRRDLLFEAIEQRVQVWRLHGGTDV